MPKRINFDIKEQMVGLAGACFWFWNSFYSFLDISGVPKSLYQRYPKDVFNKYQVMRNIIGVLEEQGQIGIINALISNYYRLKNAVDRDNLDTNKAKLLLQEFRGSVGNDPIESAIKEQQREKARVSYTKFIESVTAKKESLSDLNRRFLSLSTDINFTPQQRGFKLETLFFDLLHFAEFDHTNHTGRPMGNRLMGISNSTNSITLLR